MFLIELKRAFSRRSFKIAVSIGIVFCVLSLVKFSTFEGNDLNNYLKGFVHTPFDDFILFNLNWMSNLLIIIMPIISTLGYSDSYIEDVKSGFIKGICTRKEKRSYLLSKYFANFIAGGAAFSLPLLLNYIVLILMSPSIQPDRIFGGGTIAPGGLFPNFFYGHGNSYVMMWILIYFLYSGAFASIALSFSTLIKNKFVILFIPFILYFLVDIFAGQINKMQYSPQVFLYKPIIANPTIILFEFIFVFAGTMILFFLGGLKNEIY